MHSKFGRFYVIPPIIDEEGIRFPLVNPHREFRESEFFLPEGFSLFGVALTSWQECCLSEWWQHIVPSLLKRLSTLLFCLLYNKSTNCYWLNEKIR